MRKSLFIFVLFTVPLILIGANGCKSAALPPGASNHVTGTITAFDRDHIEVTGEGGKSVSVKLGPGTRYVIGNGRASAADLAVGRRCMVRFTADQSATEVYLEAPEKKPAS